MQNPPSDCATGKKVMGIDMSRFDHKNMQSVCTCYVPGNDIERFCLWYDDEHYVCMKTDAYLMREADESDSKYLDVFKKGRYDGHDILLVKHKGEEAAPLGYGATSTGFVGFGCHWGDELLLKKPALFFEKGPAYYLCRGQLEYCALIRKNGAFCKLERRMRRRSMTARWFGILFREMKRRVRYELSWGLRRRVRSWIKTLFGKTPEERT